MNGGFGNDGLYWSWGSVTAWASHGLDIALVSMSIATRLDYPVQCSQHCYTYSSWAVLLWESSVIVATQCTCCFPYHYEGLEALDLKKCIGGLLFAAWMWRRVEVDKLSNLPARHHAVLPSEAIGPTYHRFPTQAQIVVKGAQTSWQKATENASL